MIPGKMTSPNTLFITGTDTDVGKTWISRLLLEAAVQAGLNVGAYKPACSGAVRDADGKLVWGDVEELWAGSGKAFPRELICPQCFEAPLAPNEAAHRQNLQVSNALLLDGYQAWQQRAEFMIVEGAGGLLCPLTDLQTVADLAEKIGAPLVIVAANRLGVINHTMLTVEYARSRNLDIRTIVLNEVTPQISDESAQTNLSQLVRMLPGQVLLQCGYGSRNLQSVDGEIMSPVDLWA